MRRGSPFLASVMALAMYLASQRATPAREGGAQGEMLRSLVQPERGLIEWRFKERKLLAYSYAGNQFKPYVRELCSLTGDNVLRDAPEDHLHHHGLMYAVRVNGVNFWEENDQPGHQRHIKLLAQNTGRNQNGLTQAAFTELIHWVPDGDASRASTTDAAFLVEQRTLTLTVDEANEEVALAWHAEFEVGARTNSVTLHGSEYNGLGLRLPAEWDHAARHENSEGTPHPADGRPGAVPARWAAVSHARDGRTTQVALFARPSGQGGANRFFAMTEPFAYLAATQALDKKPLNFRFKEQFKLDYLVLVYATARTSAQLEKRYQAWAKELESNER